MRALCHVHPTNNLVISSGDVKTLREQGMLVPLVITCPDRWEAGIFIPLSALAVGMAYNEIEELPRQFALLSEEKRIEILKKYFFIITVDLITLREWNVFGGLPVVYGVAAGEPQSDRGAGVCL